MGLQYRAAAIAGIATQFAWGFMEIMIFHALYRTNPDAFPMTFQETVSYLWLQQAFVALFMTWFMEMDIFESIVNGNIAYELCRPIRIYNMWFVRSIANRLSKAVLRCFPVIFLAALLPAPYGIMAPSNWYTFLWFLITMALGLIVTVAMGMLIYVLAFFTISSHGLRIIYTSLGDLLTGAIIPLPFFPTQIARILEILPFGSMQNVPLRVYSGNIAGLELFKVAGLQVFWIIVLISLGKSLCKVAEKRVALQGG